MGESLGCGYDGMIEYCMDSSFLRFAHVMIGDLVFNLLVVNSGDPISLEKAMCIAF